VYEAWKLPGFEKSLKVSSRVQSNAPPFGPRDVERADILPVQKEGSRADREWRAG
jgi:hypothetical protein